MPSSLKAPKVFISYSWKPISNKFKTIELAERLVDDGIDVVLDIWNLKEGQDKYKFMEQMVLNPEIKRVLVICNKEYKTKADSKKGGVGIESLIISDEIYSNADQEKFIPVIFAADENEKPYMPVFVKTRIYIDLSSESTFEDEYERLVRNIFEKPLNRKPSIGKPPIYITEEIQTSFSIVRKRKTVENALINEKVNFQSFIDDYYSSFINELDNHKINLNNVKKPPYIDDVVLIKIADLKPLRDDFILFLRTLLKYSNKFNLDIFIDFIEKVVQYMVRANKGGFNRDTYGYLMLDHFRFFLYELFLYTSAIFIENSNFIGLRKLVDSDFIFFTMRDKTDVFSILLFNQRIESLESGRKKRLGISSVSLTADLIRERADIASLSFQNLMEIDILLYFIFLLEQKPIDPHKGINRWFPYTASYDYNSIVIVNKLRSKRHFDKIKIIFNVETVVELKKKVENVKINHLDQVESVYFSIPLLDTLFDFNEIAKYN